MNSVSCGATEDAGKVKGLGAGAVRIVQSVSCKDLSSKVRVKQKGYLGILFIQLTLKVPWF